MKNLIKAYRIKQNLTLKKLAQIADIGIVTISDTERGVSTPKVDTALRIARALHCRVEDIFILDERETDDEMQLYGKGKRDFKRIEHRSN